MIAVKSSSRKKSKPRARKELVASSDGSVWEVHKRSAKEVILLNPFTGASRRPKPLTFSRDYSPIAGPGQVGSSN